VPGHLIQEQSDATEHLISLAFCDRWPPPPARRRPNSTAAEPRH
jgi:hypothetical protein